MLLFYAKCGAWHSGEEKAEKKEKSGNLKAETKRSKDQGNLG
jgi:hypothetical protein